MAISIGIRVFLSTLGETPEGWAKRRHDLASHLSYARRSPEKVKAAIESANDWKKRNPERHQAWTDQYTKDNRGQVLFNAAKRRALSKKLEIDITRDWIQERINKGICEVTGLPFVLRKGRSIYSPSVDRTDPSKGYTKDNCKVVLWGYNTAKNDFTRDELLALAKAIVKAHGE